MAPKTKAKAQSAAQAASKKKSSAVEITHHTEQQIRQALKELDVPWETTTLPTAGIASQSAALPASKHGQPSAEQLLAVYAALQHQHGFEARHVEAALSALPLAAISEESALDWLLLHLDSSELPRRYAVSWRLSPSGTVDVKNKAREVTPAEAAAEAAAAAAVAAEQAAMAQVELQRRREQDAAQAAEAQRAAEEARAKEEEQRREWIKQYMEEGSGSEAGSDGSQVEAESDASSIEDWEVWGDPREQQRRQQARSRERLPREQRLALIAAEMAHARREAAAAKAGGRKEQQKACGQLIGRLRQEMQGLGISDAELEAAMPQTDAEPAAAAPAAPAAAAAGGEAVGGDAGGGQAGVEREGSQLSEGVGAEERHVGETANNEGSGGSSPAAGAGAGTADSGDASEGASSSGDEGGLGFDLFGDGSALEGAEVVKAKRSRAELAAAAAATLQPWGGGGSGKKKGGGKAAPPPKPELQQPKSLLQQHCQRCSWAAPRFERLPHGGMRLEGGGYRYSVVVDASGGGKAPKRKQQQQQQQQQQGPRSFSLREAEDGWQRIEDAQNAAATRALFELAATDAQLQEACPPLWAHLPPEFQEMWLVWQAEGEDGEAGEAAAAATEEAVAARQEFVQQLLSRGGAQQAQQAATAAVGTAAGTDGGGWQQDLLAAIAAAAGNEAQRAQQAAAQQRVSERLHREQAQWRASEEGRQWLADRGRLPVTEVRQQLIEALSCHDVVVVSGETGSGKTTQVPQYILEAAVEAGGGGACSVVCTQPRRIAAISVAQRVANERGEVAPGQQGCKVGYHVRLDAATSRDTRLLFCTTGILLRRLAGDPALLGVSHVLVDEVHERTLQGDFLITLLRDLVAVRRAAAHPLKVVLMSATLDSALFADYFGGCPVLHAQGRTFPVEQRFLEDAYQETGYVLDADSPAALRPQWDRGAQRRVAQTAGSKNLKAVQAGWGDALAGGPPLNPHFSEEELRGYSPLVERNIALLAEDRIDFDLLELLVAHIDETAEADGVEGAVLVFLPGMGEIQELADRLCASRRFRANSSWVIPLHSTVSPSDQQQAFRVPPAGVRKVVLATNIAETSLTIEDVVFVVDSGKLKERRYDASRGMSLLVEDWVSAASAKQRRGRAGRVRPGICYGLYTRGRYESRMRRYQAPEMVRVPLEELVLQIHLLRLGKAGTFLAKVLQPPPDKSVAGAIRALQEVGALTAAEELTPLGLHLAALPVDARIGKLLLLSASLGCLAPALTIAACLSYKSPFTGGSQQDAADRARAALAAPGSRTIAAGQQSDHLLMVAAVDGWLAARSKGGHQAAREYSRRHFLSQQALEMLADMRWQYASMLADIGFVAAPGGGRGGGRTWMDARDAPFNRYASHPAVVKAVLLAALYPNVAVMDDEAAPGKRPGWHDGIGEVAIHPSSICHMLESQQYQRPYVMYLEKVRTSRTFIRDCTVASPAAILLFGGALSVAHDSSYVQVDGWLRIRAPAQTAVLVKRLRQALDAMWRERWERRSEAAAGSTLISTIVDLLNHEEAARKWDR
ncbi:hypothetical protein D9Q98_003461 [Chlorella vulgaris]|uniref:RNA helicase n=1 Tax=Chlorella vulgaris TaxID=3077 RepID=A0A9D4YYI7_CHLVU|nr:hypothetical protein D9Q98_003461 [Chlorella vulgaris]